jgi:hypothetical protein
MTWMNEYDVGDAYDAYAERDDLPNLAVAVVALSDLVTWTNRNSDGWPYWQKPSRAASKLQGLIQSVDRWHPKDLARDDVKRAITPIKAFLTRQGVAYSDVFR